MDVTINARAPTPPATLIPIVAAIVMPVAVSVVEAWVRPLDAGIEVPTALLDAKDEDMNEDVGSDCVELSARGGSGGVEVARKRLVGSATRLVGRILVTSRSEEVPLSSPGRTLVTKVEGNPDDAEVVTWIVVAWVVGGAVDAVVGLWGAALALVLVVSKAAVAVVLAGVVASVAPGLVVVVEPGFVVVVESGAAVLPSSLSFPPPLPLFPAP